MHHSIISLRIIWWTRKLRLWLGLGNEQPAGILVCSGPWQHNVSCGSKWLRGQRKWERTQASRSGRFSVLRFSWFLMSRRTTCALSGLYSYCFKLFQLMQSKENNTHWWIRSANNVDCSQMTAETFPVTLSDNLPCGEVLRMVMEHLLRWVTWEMT